MTAVRGRNIPWVRQNRASTTKSTPNKKYTQTIFSGTKDTEMYICAIFSATESKLGTNIFLEQEQLVSISRLHEQLYPLLFGRRFSLIYLIDFI